MGEANAVPLSAAEFQAALEELGSGDLGRLERAARHLSAGTEFGPDDLLQEAVCRTLEEERVCPRHVGITAFLYNAMKSIASALRKRGIGYPPHDSLDFEEGGGAVAPGRSAEELLVARADYSEGVRALQALFDDDPQALLVVMGDLDGVEAAELKELAGMDDKTFATVRRRIRRKIEKAFPGGWKP